MMDFQQNTKLDRPAFLIRTKSLREILNDLRKAEMWLLVAAIAAFLASAFFVVKYFVGGEMTPDTWTGEQWMNAFLGLGITAVITAAQAFLYASGYKGQAALIATFIVVFFGLFSEISQSMEREDATVRARSESSAVFKATLGSISTLSSAPVLSSAASSELARAQQKAAKMQTRIDNKNRCNSCETVTFRELRGQLADAKGRVAAAQSRVNMEMQATSNSNAAALQSAISTAKTLEYDEDKHYAMIRLLKQLFGVTGIWASFLFSIIIIGTFEYAFHFVGSYVADHKRSLRMLGRDTRGRRINNDEFGSNIPAEAALQEGKSPIPQDRANDLREEYLDWVSPERDSKTTSTSTAAEEKGRDNTTKEKAPEFTKKRFFKLIYTEVRNQILNGEIRPTVRPVTDAVTNIMKHKSELLGIKPSMIGKPQRQQIAQLILQHLEQETVVTRNTEGGVGKPKYVLSPKYMAAIDLNRAIAP
uniref:Uncharacterized protein n=1 Tax=uncultured Thiotrichaceae bacterium TaxID=298394 RepID=A0A6S6U766_9GAMM|nr:MAG: Unknown protein [uncultured Thiotrichaceae bacterium]